MHQHHPQAPDAERVRGLRDRAAPVRDLPGRAGRWPMWRAR